MQRLHLQTLIERLPLVLILAGVVVSTGSYRGRESAESSPTIGTGLAVLGVVAYGGLAYSGSD